MVSSGSLERLRVSRVRITGRCEPARRQPISRLMSQYPTGRGARSANGSFAFLLYRVNEPATIVSSDLRSSHPLHRARRAEPPDRKTHLEWYRQ